MRRSARRQTVRATCSAAPAGAAAGENETPQRRQLGLEPIDQLLEPRDVVVAERRPS